MKIRIRTDEVKLNFRFPTILLTGPLGFRFFMRQSAKTRWQSAGKNRNTDGEREQSVKVNSTPILKKASSRVDMRKLRRTIKKLKKQYPEFPLVEVETEDGDTVKIIL